MSLLSTQCSYCTKRKKCSEIEKLMGLHLHCFKFDGETYKDIPKKYLPWYCR